MYLRLGVGTIAIVNVIVIVRALISSVNNPAEKCDENLTFIGIVNGITVIAFAYGGHVLMVRLCVCVCVCVCWRHFILNLVISI